MKDHAQFADALALYAMDALDDQSELAELEQHLGTCGECRRELEALRGDSGLLALSATGPRPPQRSRERLMRTIAAEPRNTSTAGPHVIVGRLRPRWQALAPIAVALLLVVFSLVLVRQNLRLQERNAKLRDEIQQIAKESALAREVMAMLNDQQAVRMTLVGVQKPAQPQVKTVYKPEKGHVLLLASNLEALPEDKVYELWLIPADGSAPMPAGTFQPDSKGSTLMMHAFDTMGVQAKAFAVTIEPRGGSASPSGAPVMAPPS